MYDLEDAFLMWEAVIVPKVNEYLSMKQLQAKR